VTEYEIRADEVQPGDYIAGLGRVQSFTKYGQKVTLASEWDLWRLSVLGSHRLVVLR
jgi:hypothetical protein